MLELHTALRRLPPGSVFSGLTAAWLHGIDVSPIPIDATIPLDAGVSSRAGIAIRRSRLEARDVVEISGLRATSISRTLADVCARVNLTEAVVVIDAALHAHRIQMGILQQWIDANPGRGGIRKLRRALAYADAAAESPMESRLRVLLVLNGLPRPAAQVPIHDSAGRFVGRPDLYYAEHRLGIEYDGAVHRTSLAEDNRRQNLLLGAGIHLLRFTAADVMQRPDSVVNQVRAMLNSSPIAGKRSA